VASKAFRLQPAPPPADRANSSTITTPKSPPNIPVETRVINPLPVVSILPAAVTNAAAAHAEFVHQRIEELNAWP